PAPVTIPPGHAGTVVPAGIAAHSIAAIRSELRPTPASVKTLPTASVESGATPAYLPSSDVAGVPSPVPDAMADTWVPCPLRSSVAVGEHCPPSKFWAATTLGGLSGCDQ